MTNETERDSHGMQMLPDGNFALMTTSHPDDPRLTSLEAKVEECRVVLNAILAKLNVGIKVQTVVAL